MAKVKEIADRMEQRRGSRAVRAAKSHLAYARVMQKDKVVLWQAVLKTLTRRKRSREASCR